MNLNIKSSHYSYIDIHWVNLLNPLNKLELTRQIKFKNNHDFFRFVE